MFSRFSDASRRVLRAAEQECRNHNHYYVGVEHLLLALLECGDAAIEAKLAAAGIDVRSVHAELRRSLGTGDDRLWDGILITPRVRKVVRIAEGAVAAGNPIEPGDLYAAIEHEGGGLAFELLQRAARS
jgi:ATP-dependent Clp protease ATP-binding subunit ClpA